MDKSISGEAGEEKKEDVDDGGEAREYPSQPQNRKSARAEEF